MPTDKPHHQHLTRSEDLVTSYEEIRAGFVALALEKGRRASPLIAEARALKAAASKATSPADLVKITEIQPALLTAAGVSDKAEGHMDLRAKAEAIQGLIEKFLEPAGSNFVEELVFRFLLTRGDTLGGSMRNWGGELAQRKLTRAVISALSLSKISYQWLPHKGREWLRMSEKDADIELHLKGLSWSIGSRIRTMMYNLKVPMVLDIGKKVMIRQPGRRSDPSPC